MKIRKRLKQFIVTPLLNDENIKNDNNIKLNDINNINIKKMVNKFIRK